MQASNTNTVRMISIQTDKIESNSIEQNKFSIWEREIPMSLLLDHSHTLRKRLEIWYHQQKDILLSPDEPVNWPSYILGILAKLIEQMNQTGISPGFNVVIISDVPCNKGVASSAALEVSVARAGNSKSSLIRT